MSRKRDVFQLDDNDALDANTSDAVGWSCDDGLGYRILAPEYQPLNYFLCILADAWSRHDVVLVGRPNVGMPQHHGHGLDTHAGLHGERRPRVAAFGHRGPGGAGTAAGGLNVPSDGVGRQLA